MKQEQLEKEGIKVGDYYVVRQGKRIAIMASADVYGVGDPTTELILTEKQATHLLGAHERLQKKENERGDISLKVDKLRLQIEKLDDQIIDLEEKEGEAISESFKGYDIELSRDGIDFGCTNVTGDHLAAIRKLLKKGGK